MKSNASSGAAMRILVVEDNELNRRVVSHMLGTAGIQADEADEGAAGLSMINAHDYDVVLMDLRMPVMDGLSAIRAIRARRDAKGEVPVIVLTADTGPDIRAECLLAGADDMIMKPVGMNSLFDAIVAVTTKRNGLSGLVA
jgi:CheY-like chemotaxis protein